MVSIAGADAGVLMITSAFAKGDNDGHGGDSVFPALRRGDLFPAASSAPVQDGARVRRRPGAQRSGERTPCEAARQVKPLPEGGRPAG